MGAPIQPMSEGDFSRRIESYLSSHDRVVSKAFSQELCDIADISDLQVKSAYYRMLTSRTDAMLPTPLLWEDNARKVCEEKMKKWPLGDDELSPNQAIDRIKENLENIFLIEFLLPKAIPFNSSLEEMNRSLHELLKAILGNSEIDNDKKQHYSRLLKTHIIFYFASVTTPESNISELTQYQSAANKLFNDFDLFTENPATTFGHEVFGVLSWKSFFSIFMGGSTLLFAYPPIKEHIRLTEQTKIQERLTAATGATKVKARQITRRASLSVMGATYLIWTILETLYKQKREKTLEECRPPFCPIIETQ